MKGEGFIWGIANILVMYSLWNAHHFQQEHEFFFDKNAAEYKNLKKSVDTIKKELDFLKQHQKEFEYLKEKGWMQPKSRLIAGNSLEEISDSLSKINYRFEPEVTKRLEDKYLFTVTQMTIDVEASRDTDIYDFMERLLENFSGIVRVSELILKRDQDDHMIVGRLIMEWMAMGCEKNE